MSTEHNLGPKDFPLTSKTLYQRIQAESPTSSTDALNEFFSRYWLPLYSFLRASGESHDDASDFVQGFVSREILERDQLKDWDPDKGSLRGFLKMCLDRYRKKQWRHELAEKRGGQKSETHVSIDFDWADNYFENNSLDGESPEKNFDREWAAAIVNQATVKLAQLYAENGNELEFRLLLQNLSGRGEEENPANYKEISVQLNITVEAVKQRMRTFRVKFQQCLRQVVADFVNSGEIENELTFLLGLLGR